jgi:hypothetical protein
MGIVFQKAWLVTSTGESGSQPSASALSNQDLNPSPADCRLFDDAPVALIINDFVNLEIGDRAVGTTLWRFGDVRAKTSL